jgi:hypothetical protein
LQKVKEYNKQRSNYDPDIEHGEESLTNIQQLIKDNHIKLQDEIAEDLPLEQSPEARNLRDNMSQGDEIKDETEATGQSPLGMRHIEEDIIPDLTEGGVGNTEVTTEMLVNDVMKANIELHSKN